MSGNNKDWAIRISRQVRPSDGVVLASLEFNEEKFTHLGQWDREAASLALIKAAAMLMEGNLVTPELSVIHA